MPLFYWSVKLKEMKILHICMSNNPRYEKSVDKFHLDMTRNDVIYAGRFKMT